LAFGLAAQVPAIVFAGLAARPEGGLVALVGDLKGIDKCFKAKHLSVRPEAASLRDSLLVVGYFGLGFTDLKHDVTLGGSVEAGRLGDGALQEVEGVLSCASGSWEVGDRVHVSGGYALVGRGVKVSEVTFTIRGIGIGWVRGIKTPSPPLGGMMGILIPTSPTLGQVSEYI
jgi:hypothetical protein